MGAAGLDAHDDQDHAADGAQQCRMRHDEILDLADAEGRDADEGGDGTRPLLAKLIKCADVPRVSVKKRERSNPLAISFVNFRSQP